MSATSTPPLPRIVLGVTGGIAAYKAAELVRLLVKGNVVVDVVLTEAGAQFLTATTFQALSGRPVLSDLWHSGAADDALFEAEDGRVFQVHLTLSRRPEQPPLPRTRVYANAAEWIQQVMLPANEEYRG